MKEESTPPTSAMSPLGSNAKLNELIALAAINAATESGSGCDLAVITRYADHAARLWAEHLSLMEAARISTPSDQLVFEWRDGPPPKPWSGEWFIALTTYGDRVVLRSLPEEYSYDFKTADETYIKADKIAAWMQFPDSQYVAPAALNTPQPIEREAYWAKWPNGDAGDAVDYACDHAKEPVFFLEDWRKDGAAEWPEYHRWLAVQRDGARASSASQGS